MRFRKLYKDIPMNFELTNDQQAAKDAIMSFLDDPVERTFVLSGYAGCGKSTLVKNILDTLEKREELQMLLDPNFKITEIFLTATSNKAAENLSSITGWGVPTIHSLLGLRVERDYMTGQTKLKGINKCIHDAFIIIDEASFIDSHLLRLIYKHTANCKLLFIGDPAQLAPVKSTTTPVFTAGFSEASLTTVVRQADQNPIIQLATQLRNTVNTGEWSSFTPDCKHVLHVSRDQFDELAKQEFTRKDWHYQDSKILAWTNRRVMDYNKAISELVKGHSTFQAGDYAICNNFIHRNGDKIKTDQMVHITGISGPYSHHFGVVGYDVRIKNHGEYFLCADFNDRIATLKRLEKAKDWYKHNAIAQNWIDLRPAYAQTIDKSQGSTYQRVFIDLDDIRKCNSGNQLARMLYVAVSRAKEQVIFTGDLV